MPLMDALRSGVDLVNAANQGVGTAANARYAYSNAQQANEYQKLINQYYGPEHQAAIDYQTITNQYLPDKLRLGNDYQGLVNKWYAPNIQSEINAKNAETQFTPLKYAIQAENAMRNNSRFGGSYQYLKSVADLPAEQRSIWMANPDNYTQYQAEIQNLHNSMSNQGAGGGGSSSLITPALLKRVGLESLSQDIVGAPAAKGVIVSPQQTGGLAAPLAGMSGAPAQGGSPQVVVNVPQPQQMPQGQPVSQPQGGMAAPLQGMTPMGAPPMAPPQMGGMTPMGAPQAPMGVPQGQPPMGGQPQRPMAPNQGVPPAPNGGLPANTPPLTPTAAAVGAKDGVAPQEANQVANDAKNDGLTPQMRQQLGFQMVANKKMVGQYITNRALGAVTLEKLLVDNQDRFAPAFENASKYAGLLGAGQLTIDQFKKEHPQEYQDYMWVTQDLVPNLSNNVKVMEGLSSTNQQRHALNDMYLSVLQWKSDPKMAINNINKTIGLFKAQAQASLAAAQPQYPGVLEQLYGLKMSGKDYVGPGRMSEQQQSDIKKLSDADIMRMLQGGK